MPGKETKKRILEAATKLFATYGYDDVTMRDIGKMVGITEGAIYRHFEGKAKILDEIISQLGEKVSWILHQLDKERMDKYIENEEPRQVLERCKISFSTEEYIFMVYAFCVVFQEHLTNPAAYELVIRPLYFELGDRLRYVLDRLQERGGIPHFNTTAFSLVWARFGISSLMLWASLSNSGTPPEEAKVDYPSTVDWLIESALTGKVQ